MEAFDTDRYRTLFEKCADSMLIIEGTRFVDCNNAALEMMGYEHRNELLSIHPSEISPQHQPDGRLSSEKANEMIALAFSQGNHRFEWIHRRANGEDFPVDIVLTVISLEQENVLHVSWRDITGRKLIEEKLRHSQKMEAVGQLAGGIAHDFNNLLSVMMGNLEILGNAVREDTQSLHHVNSALAAVDRGASLTQRLLAFSRQQTLTPVTANIMALIGGLEDILKRSLGEMIDLTITQSPRLWPAVLDENQFENALINLAINARDAMPDGGSLTITSENITLDKTSSEPLNDISPGDYICISVTDTGSGMPAETAEKAFDPFFTTKKVGEGTGLGLSMVYGFITQIQGHVSITSEVGKGTTVQLYLPRSPLVMS